MILMLNALVIQLILVLVRVGFFFVDNISKVSLYSASEPKTLEDTKRWLMRQVAPSLAAVIVSEDGDLSFIQSLADSGTRRFSMRHINMIESAHALEISV